MAGRTLTQYAVPITFGLVCAQWLTGFQDALDDVEATSSALPVQCGGAAGTLSLAAEVLPDVGAALGKSIREFRKASSDIQDAARVDTTPIPPTSTTTASAPATPSATSESTTESKT